VKTKTKFLPTFWQPEFGSSKNMVGDGFSARAANGNRRLGAGRAR
jgi:hypothetical protein